MNAKKWLKQFLMPDISRPAWRFFGGAGTVIGAIKRWIDESDIYFLLLGGMYGSIYEENSEKISFTEWEYRYACSINKPVCAIILDESMLHSKAAKW